MTTQCPITYSKLLHSKLCPMLIIFASSSPLNNPKSILDPCFSSFSSEFLGSWFWFLAGHCYTFFCRFCIWAPGSFSIFFLKCRSGLSTCWIAFLFFYSSHKLHWKIWYIGIGISLIDVAAAKNASRVSVAVFFLFCCWLL